MMLRPDRPFTARLPSGVRVTVTGRRIAPAPASLPAALAAGVVDADVDLKALPLADAHVVEGLLVAAGVVEPPPLRCPCHNCGKDLVLEARPFLPVAPLLDPPSDDELDHVPLGEQEHVLAHPVTLRGNDITTFRLAPRTLADRARLEALLGNDPSVPLRVDGPLVRALGLVALGPRTSPIAIARVLQALDDDAFADVWDAIADAYEDQHWPPRLLVAVPCPHCGARHDVEAAGPRLFGLASPRPPTEPFPSLATFRARAEAIVEELFAREDPAVLERLAVVVQDGVPPCDDGGEPLLGSYTPTPRPTAMREGPRRRSSSRSSSAPSGRCGRKGRTTGSRSSARPSPTSSSTTTTSCAATIRSTRPSAPRSSARHGAGSARRARRRWSVAAPSGSPPTSSPSCAPCGRCWPSVRWSRSCSSPVVADRPRRHPTGR